MLIIATSGTRYLNSSQLSQASYLPGTPLSNATLRPVISLFEDFHLELHDSLCLLLLMFFCYPFLSRVGELLIAV